MSITGISSLALGADVTSQSTNAVEAESAPSAANSGDTVQLTEAEQVYLLYTQGQSVSQIANTLGLPVALVDNYLNLSNSAV
jgi:DNA-binding CsgD family transcriptional regulator